MSGDGFDFDVGDFREKFSALALKTVPEAAEAAMFAALSEVKHDADAVTPKTPHLEGNLRGDYDFVLDGITQSKVVSTGNKGNPKAKPSERYGAKSIVAKIIFRMPYAAKWHEAVGKKINWSEAGVGPKYLESKLSMFRRKYWGMVAEAVKAALESKGAAR